MTITSQAASTSAAAAAGVPPPSPCSLQVERVESPKPAAVDMSASRRAALVISVFGSWLFYLAQVRKGADLSGLRDTLLEEWATRWAAELDSAP